MNQYLKTIQDILQRNKKLSEAEKEALIKATTDADKQWSITEFKLDRTEKVKRTTAILLEETIAELEQKRKAVEAQNRELEIESSLERVRTVALSMNRPDDMLHVCSVISEQLQHLNVQEIRNVQTAIFYETKGTYINYEFYAKHNKTLVTEVDYKNHAVQKGFADQMLKGPNEIFIHSFNGKEVQDWYDFQKTTNQFLDTYLETAIALNYYWYSLGPVALGISTYNPLSEEETNLFKRFLKVFELSYRRYLDIEKAEAQAYEAKVEASLEKVRAVAMSMNKPDDLLNVCETLYKEFNAFGFVNLRNAIINIHNDDNKTFVNYDYSDTIGKSTNHLVYDIHPVIEKQIKQIRSANDAFSETVFAGKDLTEWKKFRKKIGEKDDPRIKKAKALHYYFYSIGTGSIGISTFIAVNKENLDLLKRYRNVFNLSYQRYTDLALAEAQAQEAKIEASLERMRAGAMSMRKSEELISVCEAMYKELTVLGFTNIRNAQVAIKNDAKQSYTVFEYSDYAIGKGEAGYKSSPIVEELYNELGEFKDALYQKEFSGKEFDDWRTWRKGLNTSIDGRIEQANSMCFYLYSFDRGHLGISTFNSITNEQVEILKRFKNVFELSYRRYIDVAQAEEQAREAQIELALERVRARTMAMQKSEELSETVYILFQQFRELGENPDQATIGIINEDEWVIEYWVTMYGNQMNRVFKFSIDEPNVTQRIYKAWKENEKSLVIDLGGKELYDFTTYRASMGGAAYNESEKRRIINVAFFSKGLINVQSTESRSEESIRLLERFAAVFEQTYTRFLDLQKAEAQARESQIQLAMERVRARTMAMQKSDELTDAASLLFKQLEDLGIKSWSSGFNIWQADGRSATINMCNPDGSIATPYHLPHTEDIFFIRICDARQKGDDLLVMETGGKELEETYNYMFSLPQVKKVLGAMEDTGFQIPKFQVNHCAFFSQGYLMFITYEPVPEMWDVFKRFAKVFEQTYTRFLDLQKAEAQARESQIQLALERVRARAMAMQHSDELKELIGTVYNELTKLDLALDRCLIWVMNSENLSSRLWMANAESQPVNFYIPNHDNPPYLAFVKAWKDRNTRWQYDLRGQVKKEWDGYVFNHTEMKHLPDPVKKSMQATDGVMLAASFHNFGCLQTAGPETLKEEQFDILNRFAKVFDLTYTRFNDLKQAEAQARESQIELGLERVRARAMAMQKSDELSELVDTVFKELTKLDFALTWCIINIIDESSMSNTVWAANPDIEKAPESYHMLFEDYPFHHAMMKGWKERKIKYVYTLEGSEKKIYDDYLFSETEFKRTPEAAQIASRAMEKYVVSFSFSNFGGLQTVGDVPLSDANLDILSRFGKVFDLTYTRFNDLKQAEAQARESHIQLALERVRARTMAMQRSDELKNAAALLFQQAKALGVPAYSCGYNIWEKNDKTFTSWMSTQDGSIINGVPDIPLTEDANFIRYVESKQKGEQFFVLELRGERMQEHYEYLKTIPAFKTYFDYAVSVGFDLPQTQIHYVANFSQGNLLFITLEPCPEFHDVFKRFAVVFEQTYTRFLDLQTAEAQAREAKIEVALEKVRSRTMAMQKSDELGDVATVLFKEMNQLVDNLWTCGFVLCEKNRAEDEWWLSAENGFIPAFYLPNVGDVTHYNIYQGWLNGEEYHTEQLEGKALQEHYDWLMAIPITKKIFDDLAVAGIERPQWQKLHCAYFSKGYLCIITQVPCPDEIIFRRFAQVFDLTYTRFLDLQKAEAQARESQIEAALERVRSRSMGMQKSEELKEVIQVVYEQFVHLNILVEHTGFIMDYKERNDMHIWLADKHAVPFQVTIPYFDCAHWNSFNEAKATGKDFFANHLSFEEKNKFYKDLFKLIPGVPEETLKYYFSCPGLAISTVLLENVGLYIENFSGISYSDEENATLMRFGKVFQQTYTRFNDLQKAEAQAREATKQASLDRVRGQIASMRSTDDLQRITPLIWHELTTLDVPFIRCGVLIIDETKAEAHIYLSSPDGHSLGAMNLPLHSNTLTANSVEYWRKGMVYTEHWTKEDFVHWMQSMIEQRQVQNPETYQGAAKPPESLHLHFVPFTQGMLYVGNTALLTNDEIDLVKSLAEAFSIAYARYEDFIKLEKAKQSIEVTLTELKATQTQLIQSEKMASLGELTAGIAHEIQNPLNFVNNFSEVNKELLAEMTEEIDKGNFEEAKSLAKDVTDNEEKINHHGKRADAIVKGMLQHSRASTGVKEPTDINALADEYLRLAYHGLRAKDKAFNATLETDFDNSIGYLNIVPQDIGRVILNLITNAFYAVTEKKNQQSGGLPAGLAGYEPTVSVSTKKMNGSIELTVKDNGNGIQQKVLEKIFQPFFTTKPTGEGTGLGLSLSYDIVKAHGGELKVETKEGEYAGFVITLPLIPNSLI